MFPWGGGSIAAAIFELEADNNYAKVLSLVSISNVSFSSEVTVVVDRSLRNNERQTFQSTLPKLKLESLNFIANPSST